MKRFKTAFSSFVIAGVIPALISGWALTAASGCDKEKDKTETKDDKETDKTEPGDIEEKGEVKEEPAAKPAATSIKLSTPPTEEETKGAAELADKIQGGKMSPADFRNKENKRLFVLLAATHNDPKVIGQALRGMNDTHFKADDIDDDYIAVTAAHLGSTDNRVLSGAFRAVTKVLTFKKETDQIIKALAANLSPDRDAAVRYAALEAARSGDILKNEAVASQVLKALDAKENFIVAQALLAVKSGPRHETSKVEDFRKKIESLLKHSDPAVRGEACVALARIVPMTIDEEIISEIGDKIMPLLGDEHAFVISRAAEALAPLKHEKAIHEIVKHLDDKRPNTYTISIGKNIDGQSTTAHFDGSAWSRLNDAMLRSMQTMSFFTKKSEADRFSYEVSFKTRDEDLDNAVAAAKKWYAKHKSAIPK